MEITALRVQENQENADLRPEPSDPHERAGWVAERREAVMLLAELADRDAELLRRAANGEWVSPAAHNLLLDAARECP